MYDGNVYTPVDDQKRSRYRYRIINKMSDEWMPSMEELQVPKTRCRSSDYDENKTKIQQDERDDMKNTRDNKSNQNSSDEIRSKKRNYKHHPVPLSHDKHSPGNEFLKGMKKRKGSFSSYQLRLYNEPREKG